MSVMSSNLNFPCPYILNILNIFSIYLVYIQTKYDPINAINPKTYGYQVLFKIKNSGNAVLWYFQLLFKSHCLQGQCHKSLSIHTVGTLSLLIIEYWQSQDYAIKTIIWHIWHHFTILALYHNVGWILSSWISFI